MPSFDIVSKIDKHEVTNAIDQANREVRNRFDFKDTGAHFELAENVITLVAQSKFQLQQLQQIMEPKLVKRGISLDCLERGVVQENLHEARQKVTIKFGIDHEIGKTITKLVKERHPKVQVSLMGDHVRVTGKKKDDLQAVIAALQGETLTIPLQFENFRD